MTLNEKNNEHDPLEDLTRQPLEDLSQEAKYIDEKNNEYDVQPLEDLRRETNYSFIRFLVKWLSVLFFFSSLLWCSQFNFIVGPILLVLSACSCIVFHQGYSMLIDIADASIASLPKHNQNEFPSDPLMFSGVVDELKKISEQNKEQSEALRKSIEELSEKAEKTNTYLYHIYKK